MQTKPLTGLEWDNFLTGVKNIGVQLRYAVNAARRQRNPWDEHLPEVQDWHARINGR